jgi:hypothetical protein
MRKLERDGVRERFIVLWKWRGVVLANTERYRESSQLIKMHLANEKQFEC